MRQYPPGEGNRVGFYCDDYDESDNLHITIRNERGEVVCRLYRTQEQIERDAGIGDDGGYGLWVGRNGWNCHLR